MCADVAIVQGIELVCRTAWHDLCDMVWIS